MSIPAMFPTTPIDEAQYQLGFGFGDAGRKAARALLEQHGAQLFVIKVPGVKQPALCVDTGDFTRIMDRLRQPLETSPAGMSARIALLEEQLAARKAIESVEPEAAHAETDATPIKANSIQSKNARSAS